MMKTKGIAIVFVLLVSGLCFAGGTKDDSPLGGTDSDDTPLYVGQTWLAGTLDPTQGSAPWALTSHGLTEYVFMLDRNGRLNSRFVESLEQVDDLRWEGTMKRGATFSDGTAVDAEAFCRSLMQIMERNPLSHATAGRMVFEAHGEFSFSITTERPTRVMKSVLAEWTNVIFKESENGGYVYTGPYRVDGFVPGAQLRLIPNPYYPGARKRQNVVIKVFKDVSAMTLAREADEIDMAFTVTPQAAERLQKNGDTVKSLDAGYQYFGIVNTTGILADSAIREALNWGLNREDYVKALKGGRIATGLFAHYYPFAGREKIVFDRKKAETLLEESGWHRISDGTRYKDGRPLKLRIITYSSRPDLITIIQIMTSQLNTLGIDVETEIVENIDSSLKEGEYDLGLYAQHSAPTGNPAFFLNQFFRTGASKNYMGYSSAEVDRLLDKMGDLPLGEEMDRRAVEIQRIVFQDLPVLYLVDPQWHISVSERLSDYEPYGGDYYIINAEMGMK